MSLQRALLSVSDKSGLLDLAKALAKHGVQLISTGGTAAALQNAGFEVTPVEELTGFPEMLDGRVKTLHPMVHGGLLYLRDKPEHQKQAENHGILPIDLVVVNLYPFEETIAKPGVELAEAIENIDIGGPSMIRSAAKNYQSVTVVTDPADYPELIDCLEENQGDTTLKVRERFALRAFATTSRYDTAISAYLSHRAVTSSLQISLPLVRTLRYGENPHQKAEFFGVSDLGFEQLHGKELSYNNLLDMDAASQLIAEFSESTVAILKHNNPCGVGSDEDQRAAWDKAFATDRQAPFGGVIAINRPLDEELARAISEIFSEVIIAPDYTSEARALLQKKKNLRLIRMPSTPNPQRLLRAALGGVLAQDADTSVTPRMEEHVVTERPPTKSEVAGMSFGWKVVKHVKSNAIVFCRADRTLGIGAGQMSRIDSCRIAVWKAQEAGLSLAGSVVASDAFFPFPDGLIAAAEAGAVAAVQPGGSVRDEEVIAAANQHKMAMSCTGIRNFRH
ncbi:MAG: bifunctional phosphoribosylaminoimidazolecarboxamide formyltransferase/IMP cyclohydrolase [Verrucomicrobiales bacterium]